MNPIAGSFDLGPQTCDLLLRTTSEGRMAKAGHNLTLVVRDWTATVVVGDSPETTSLRVVAQLGSLSVREGHGGLKPLSDGDRAQIEKNAASSLGVSANPELTFTSTAIAGAWDKAKMEGTLTLGARNEVQQFDIEATEAGFRVSGTITQTRYGIKPYSLMMGALKVGDEVAVEVTATLQ
ncbi:YceI family protein [Propionibacteriaceae bacterium Y1923]|uniref:YceI family protein n=1 Tax=Aestuariimicrobium sp. Y1814 TaxID=3418742 RepID=UPI003C18ADBB